MLVHNINTKFGNGAYTPVQLITRDTMAASPATWLDLDPNWSRIRIIVECGSGSVFGIRIRIHTGKNRINKREHVLD